MDVSGLPRQEQECRAHPVMTCPVCSGAEASEEVRFDALSEQAPFDVRS